MEGWSPEMENATFIIYRTLIREVSVEVARFLTQNVRDRDLLSLLHLGIKLMVEWDLPTILEPLNFCRTTPETFGALYMAATMQNYILPGQRAPKLYISFRKHQFCTFISRAALSVACSWASALLLHRGVIVAGRQRRFHSNVASSAVAHLLGLPAKADIAPKVNG